MSHWGHLSIENIVRILDTHHESFPHKHYNYHSDDLHVISQSSGCHKIVANGEVKFCLISVSRGKMDQRNRLHFIRIFKREDPLLHHINIQSGNKIHNSPKPSAELSKSQTKTQTSRSHSLTWDLFHIYLCEGQPCGHWDSTWWWRFCHIQYIQTSSPSCVISCVQWKSSSAGYWKKAKQSRRAKSTKILLFTTRKQLVITIISIVATVISNAVAVPDRISNLHRIPFHTCCKCS